MLILISVITAHILFTFIDAYWLFTWLDIPVHFFVGVGLAIVFVKNFKWSASVSIVTIITLAIGWEYVERVLGFSEALIESLSDAMTDVFFGIVGGIIGSYYNNER